MNNFNLPYGKVQRCVLVAYVLLVLACLFFLDFKIVGSSSMAPAVQTGAVVLISADLPDDYTPSRGEIVTFFMDGTCFVKRVVGLPGETISFANGAVYIDGTELEEPYLPADTKTTSTCESFQIPDGHVFVMGDNRGDSYDSRVWETPFLPTAVLRNKALLTLNPPADWEIFVNNWYKILWACILFTTGLLFLPWRYYIEDDPI